jgi:hypothetical protein
MHHTFAFAGTVGSTPNTQVPAIADLIFPQDGGGNYLPQKNMRLMFAAALSAHLDRSRLVSPPYRQVALPYIYPVNVGATPVNFKQHLNMAAEPLYMGAENPFGADATTTLTSTNTETATVVCCAYVDPSAPAPPGDVYTLRATGTTMLTAYTWSPVTLTWDQPVIQGRYSIIGGDVLSAGGIAFRLTVDNQFVRPGGLCVTTQGNESPLRQRMGGWGEWGQFDNTSLPRLEVFSSSADTAETLWLQIIKIR